MEDNTDELRDPLTEASEQSKKKRKDPRIESVEYEDIPITDPITGKVSILKVKVTKYKSAAEKQIGMKGISEELEGSEDLNFDTSFDFEE